VKKIEFGRYSFSLYPKGTNFKFRVLNNLSSSINEKQQYLLDALWNTRYDGKKFLNSVNALRYYFSQLNNNSIDRTQIPFFTSVQTTSQDLSSSKFNYSTQIANLLKVPPLGRDAFTSLVKDKGERCELKSLSLDS
jgi:hypothetical protein